MSFWFSEYHTKHARFSMEIDKQLYGKESEFQHIEVFSSKEFGKVLVVDDFVMLTEKDE